MGELNFDEFSARHYLESYYDTYDGEDTFLQDFYFDAYRIIPPADLLLEFGGGPVIYPLICARTRAKRILVADYLEANRKEIELWAQADPQAFSWKNLFNYVRTLEVAAQDVPEMEAQLRERMIGTIPCDAFADKPLGAFDPGRIDVLSVNFCPESITETEAQFERCFSNIVGLTQPGTHLIFCALEGSTGWTLDGITFACFPITEAFVAGLFARHGLIPKLVRTAPATGGLGYTGLLATLSVKA